MKKLLFKLIISCTTQVLFAQAGKRTNNPTRYTYAQPLLSEEKLPEQIKAKT